jgi:aryl-alcohol dehydrogenase-like predicted oxidoreductase
MSNIAKITTAPLKGITLPVSRLILGCDNKETVDEGAPVWDHWVEVGGNAFDTAHIYGGGKPEKALGQWMKQRGIADQVTVIVKGAHTPNCTPEGITKQLAESLERLQLSKAPIYIMHRDNTDVPVSEFVEAISATVSKGLIGIWGGSNWSTQRLEQARVWARNNGHRPPTVLNNNLSLATMEKPVWPGCISSRSAEDRFYLQANQIAHISWSSQARGYFLPAKLRDRLPEDTRPETCFGSTANAARRARAEELAEKRGVTANNIALAWVLAQPFPSFALVGPRTTDEIDSTVSGCDVELSADDVRWLDEGA